MLRYATMAVCLFYAVRLLCFYCCFYRVICTSFNYNEDYHLNSDPSFNAYVPNLLALYNAGIIRCAGAWHWLHRCLHVTTAACCSLTMQCFDHDRRVASRRSSSWRCCSSLAWRRTPDRQHQSTPVSTSVHSTLVRQSGTPLTYTY